MFHARMLLLPLVLLVAFAAGGRPLAAEDETMPIGAAEVDITPEFPIRLTGYGSRTSESTGVVQPIHARALAIGGDADRGPLVIVTVETLGVTLDLRKRVLERINESARLDGDRLAICATHTHSAPALSGLCPLILGDSVTPEQQDRIDRYTDSFVERVARAATEALKARRPGRLFHGEGKVGFAANRRVLREGSWTGFGTQADGPVDHRLPILAARDADGKLIAVLANYACHCTTIGGGFNQICGDWAGFAAEQIKAAEPEAVAMISIGCGADSNPHPRGGDDEGLALARQHGAALAAEVKRLLAGELTPLDGPITASHTLIKLPFAEPRSREEWEQMAARPNQPGAYGRRYLKLHDEGAIPATLDYSIGTVSFGDDLAMVFLAGEVVVDYSILLTDAFRGKSLWISAYANDVPCYIASRRILREGGYEADSSMIYYGQPHRLADEAEQLLVEQVKAMLPGAF